MANITPVNRRRIEPFLMMNTGYVLDFNNKTFADFIATNVNIDIYDEKYSIEGDSKANRLRALFKIESPTVVAKLLQDLIDYRLSYMQQIRNINISDEEKESHKACLIVIEDLKNDVSFIEWSHPTLDNDEDFEKLSQNIKYLIDNNQYDIGIDRLHTYVMKYFRKLCKSKNIDTRDKALHSIFGEYVKYLKAKNHIESVMTERILRSSISIIEAFNDVRNNQSLAHDNVLLKHDESSLIFKNITSLLSFINNIEQKISSFENPKPAFPTANDYIQDLPF